MIGRQRSGDDLIDSKAGPGHGAVKAADCSGQEAGIRSFKESALFDGTLKLIATSDFRHISETPAHFLFWTGTTNA
jgi:hypothetical protein